MEIVNGSIFDYEVSNDFAFSAGSTALVLCVEPNGLAYRRGCTGTDKITVLDCHSVDYGNSG